MLARTLRVAPAVAALVAMSGFSGAADQHESVSDLLTHEDAAALMVISDPTPSDDPSLTCLEQWIQYWREIEAGNLGAKQPDCKL